MNQIKAEVVKIEKIERLHHLTLALNKQKLYMVTLELPTAVEIGTRLTLSFKSTNIAISTTFQRGITIQNQLKAKITAIEHGKILTSLSLDIEGFNLESIVSTNASRRLNLKIGDRPFALINETQISVVASL
jgi:molybdopterin-binding protein